MIETAERGLIFIIGIFMGILAGDALNDLTKKLMKNARRKTKRQI
ncbi:hypothetical protein LCGC14_0556780 [marine sediment metagenome]|uniref:Uncharacterized protein n=1 Tax=marine sediment metagenome TaxID=412755 RepID=A0A0F9RN92_9ZZZZ